jgi:hypothetical protein
VTLRQIHRFASFVLVSTFAVTFGSKADDQLPHLRKGYEDCVYRSVHLQGMGGTWEAFELAFLACQSKEQAITEHLGALRVAPATIDKALQAFKLRLRKTAR